MKNLINLFVGVFISSLFILSSLSKEKDLNFERTSLTPVISSGYLGVPLFIMDPFVIKDKDWYHLFYSTLFCESDKGPYYSWDPLNPSKCNLDHKVSSIGYAFSSDKGLTWKFRESPVFNPSDSGWDSSNVETANVVLKNNQLILFYSAFGEIEGKKLKNRFQIGVASLDLKNKPINEILFDEKNTFSRNGRKVPLLSATTLTPSFFNNVQEPSVIYRNGKFELYFIGIGFSFPNEEPDFLSQKITEIGLGKAVFDDNFHLLSKTDKPILSGANITEVRYFNDKYYLFSTAFGKDKLHQEEYIEYFISNDGIKWVSQGRALTPSNTTFDNWAEVAPTVIEDEESGEYVMFYTAFGLENHKCSLKPPNARWGFGISLNECVYATLGRAVSKFKN